MVTKRKEIGTKHEALLRIVELGWGAALRFAFIKLICTIPWASIVCFGLKLFEAVDWPFIPLP